jgi:predicted amidophosphoribosyltransferase
MTCPHCNEALLRPEYCHHCGKILVRRREGFLERLGRLFGSKSVMSYSSRHIEIKNETKKEVKRLSITVAKDGEGKSLTLDDLGGLDDPAALSEMARLLEVSEEALLEAATGGSLEAFVRQRPAEVGRQAQRPLKRIDCPKCGQKIVADRGWCIYCGEVLDVAEEASARPSESLKQEETADAYERRIQLLDLEDG